MLIKQLIQDYNFCKNKLSYLKRKQRFGFKSNLSSKLKNFYKNNKRTVKILGGIGTVGIAVGGTVLVMNKRNKKQMNEMNKQINELKAQYKREKDVLEANQELLEQEKRELSIKSNINRGANMRLLHVLKENKEKLAQLEQQLKDKQSSLEALSQILSQNNLTHKKN